MLLFYSSEDEDGMSVLCMLCEREPATVFSGMGNEYCWCATCDARTKAERTEMWDKRVEEGKATPAAETGRR